MKVLATCGGLRFSQVLVQYLLALKGSLPKKSVEQLEEMELGIAALRQLPQQWSEKCSHLVQKPLLIVESLIMAKQMAFVKKLLEELPTLRDDKLLVHYARKALGLGPDQEALPYFLEKPASGTPYQYSPTLGEFYTVLCNVIALFFVLFSYLSIESLYDVGFNYLRSTDGSGSCTSESPVRN